MQFTQVQPEVTPCRLVTIKDFCARDDRFHALVLKLFFSFFMMVPATANKHSNYLQPAPPSNPHRNVENRCFNQSLESSYAESSLEKTTPAPASNCYDSRSGCLCPSFTFTHLHVLRRLGVAKLSDILKATETLNISFPIASLQCFRYFTIRQ
jgi:hypothetical protein